MIIFLLSLLGATATAGGDWAGPICANPVEIGEIRCAHYVNHCVEISGDEGKGRITHFNCYNRADSQWVWCADGTIRSKASNYCMTYEMGVGTPSGYVGTSPCRFDLDDNPHETTRWVMQGEKMQDDPFGIPQKYFQMASETHSDWCLTWDDQAMEMRQCNGELEQYYFFKSFGEQLAWGRLVNWKDESQVLDTEGNDGWGDVYAWSAKADAMDQVWAYFENGQIVNQKSGWCLDVNGNDGGIKYQDVTTTPCYYAEDTRWVLSLQNREQEGKTIFPIVNRVLMGTANQKCAMPWSGAFHSDVRVRTCDWQQHTFWYWDEDVTWTEPNGKYAQVGCNQNGIVEQIVTISTEYGSELTQSVSTEVSSTIKGGFKFAEAEVSTSVAMSTSAAFSTSYGQSSAVKFNCAFYDDGTPWQGGCMWQFTLETTKDRNSLTWKSNIVRCSKGLGEPACPPFTKCKNLECTQCEETVEGVGRMLQPPRSRNAPLDPLPQPRSRSGPPKPEKKTNQDYRQEEKCSSVKDDAEACNARGDCKAKSGKCKALSCRKIKDHEDCIHANRRCRSAFKNGLFKKCMKEGKQKS